MIKLGIFCNYGPFFSVGGSEFVIKNISDHLVKNFNYKINIYAYNYKKVYNYSDNIKLIPCFRGNNILTQVSQNDHIFIYSDSFWSLDALLKNIKLIDPGSSCALVGAYHLQSHPDILGILKSNINKFNLITHSSITPDYKFCIDNDLPVKVLPNKVDLSEFKNNNIDFRRKYNIKEKYIIINISNFFYGKGFEVLPKIYKKLSKKLDDFIILQLSNTVEYPYDKQFLNKTKQQCNGMNIRFLRDLSREDVVLALKCSDLFLFTSKKEVAPLVILESKAAGIPYVSMDVGNIKEVKGGDIIEHRLVDKKGYIVVDEQIIDDYVASIINLLKSEDYKSNIIKDVKNGIEKLDWKNVVPEYDKAFRNEV